MGKGKGMGIVLGCELFLLNYFGIWVEGLEKDLTGFALRCKGRVRVSVSSSVRCYVLICCTGVRLGWLRVGGWRGGWVWRVRRRVWKNSGIFWMICFRFCFWVWVCFWVWWREWEWEWEWGG